MVINDFKGDYFKLSELEKMSQADVAKVLGAKQNSISQALTRQIVNKMYTDIVEALGYDIKVTYVKREESAKEVLHKGV